MKSKVFLSVLIAILAGMGSTSTVRAETFAPAIHGLVLFELENDWVADSDDDDAEVNTLYTTISPYLNFALTEHLAVEASLVFEPVQDTDPGDDTEFENEGLYAEELKVSWTTDNYSLFAGKYDPTFGAAWDITPGVFGTTFAEDYQLLEKIGVGGSYTIGDDNVGEHTITANTFFADTTFLSDSWITKRGELDKDDGGVSNTEDLSSYSITLDSENPFGLDGLTTNLGYRSQAEGDADVGTDREDGYVVGANYTFALTPEIEANVIGEWAGIRNTDGSDDETDYYTAGLGLALGGWNVATSYTARNTESTTADTDDNMFQVSGGYGFENGLTLDVGYLYTEESNVDSNTLGALMTYSYEF